jgi:DNA repair exonuclease SbcCD ATPase subunit
VSTLLRKLDYSVTFPTSNRTLSEAVLFQGGFGAITGPNESGKSMIVEMIRFCLFGSAALRGKGDDYKGLKARLEFRLKGDDYVIDRTSTKATICRDDQILATGIKPVNLKVIELLGFNLDVFDMSCVANQDRLCELGDMLPTERRRRVDSVIGVAILDDLAKSAGDEALIYKRSADELFANLREPVEPVKPDGYRPSTDIAAELAELDKLRSEADQLRGWLAIEKKKPVRPHDKHGIGSAILQGYLDEQTARKVQRQVLEAELKRIPALARVVTEEELQREEEQHRLANLYRARRQFLTYHSMPDLTQLQINGLRAVWAAHKAWIKLRHLEKQKADLLAKGEHVCPSCTHHWPIAGDAIEVLDREIETFSKTLLCEEKPATTEADVDRHQRILMPGTRQAGSSTRIPRPSLRLSPWR